MNEFQTTNKGFEEVNGNELMVQENTTALNTYSMDDDERMIFSLTNKKTQYCSFVPQTEEEKDLLFMATNSPEKRIKDCVNMEITIKHIIAEVVYCESKDDPSVKVPCPRVVVIDDEGVGYQAVSIGIFSSVKNIFSSYGTPDTWSAPKTFRVLQETKGEKSILKFAPVIKKKSK